MLLLGAEINCEIEAAAAETRISASSAAVGTDYATSLITFPSNTRNG
jgi:hypothetical protein